MRTVLSASFFKVLLFLSFAFAFSLFFFVMGKCEALLIFCTAFLLSARFVCCFVLRFSDVSKEAGLDWSRGPQLKFGGACVGDLDGDGWPDLMFSHHGLTASEVYFNHGNGSFERSSWESYYDIHGITPVRLKPLSRTMHVILSRGGRNGNFPQPPLVLEVSDTKHIRQLQFPLGLSSASGRGRAALPIALQPFKRPDPDLIVTNLGKNFVFRRRHVKKNVHIYQPLRKRRLRALESNPSCYMSAVGLRQPYLQDIVSWPNLTVIQMDGSVAKDVTDKVLPSSISRDAVAAVAELDFDNDGRADLFIARASTGDLRWLQSRKKSVDISDTLLKNTGNGTYVDVSRLARIPKNLQTRGVTVGDFNNDGYIDMFLSIYSGRDIFLQNNGDGTFSRRNAPWRKIGSAAGDMATAVDFNRDGQLDLVISEGDWHDQDRKGFYRLLSNSNKRRRNQYLLIRVGASPKRKASSLHAIVTVLSRGQTMIRKVGSPGTAVCNSWIEIVHFGIGHSQPVDKVSVRWVDGAILTKRQVPVGSQSPFVFGIIP